MTQVKFNHDTSDFFQSVGYSADDVESILDVINNVMISSGIEALNNGGHFRDSQAIEKIFNSLDENQLTLLCIVLLKKVIIG